MSESIDTRVRVVEIEQARQQVVVENLAEAVLENTTAIRELTAVLNKAKGASWMVGVGYTVLGGAVATGLAWLKGG